MCLESLSDLNEMGIYATTHTVQTDAKFSTESVISKRLRTQRMGCSIKIWKKEQPHKRIKPFEAISSSAHPSFVFQAWHRVTRNQKLLLFWIMSNCISNSWINTNFYQQSHSSNWKMFLQRHWKLYAILYNNNNEHKHLFIRYWRRTGY